MNILVTGGAGFIGSHLCERFLALGHALTILDNFNDFYDPAIKRQNLTGLEDAQLVEGDIRDRDLVRKIFADGNFDAVVHLAAMAGVRPSLKDPLLYEDVNIRGTLGLLEEVRLRPEMRFVLASSSSVYGGNESVPFKETDDISRPVSPYAATKRAAELMAYTHQHLYGNPITCLRF
ncbi:MAG: UDP-glucuronate 4-epimerase, partial [Planctomycetota bacterium]